jgi:hypothetical protein
MTKRKPMKAFLFRVPEGYLAALKQLGPRKGFGKVSEYLRYLVRQEIERCQPSRR